MRESFQFLRISASGLLGNSPRSCPGNCGGGGCRCDDLVSRIERFRGHLQHQRVPGNHRSAHGELIAGFDRSDELSVQIQRDAWKPGGEVTERSKDVIESGYDEAPLHCLERIQAFFEDGKYNGERTAGLIIDKLRLH